MDSFLDERERSAVQFLNVSFVGIGLFVIGTKSVARSKISSSGRATSHPYR